MDPVTTDTAGSSSLVPCPKELSVFPLGRSSPRTRLGALTQSVLPEVLTTRLPSLPSNVLPDRFAMATETVARASAAATSMTSGRHRRLTECGLFRGFNSLPFRRWITLGTRCGRIGRRWSRLVVEDRQAAIAALSGSRRPASSGGYALMPYRQDADS